MTNVSPSSAHYDLVLIFTAFQRNCLYASIIKELASRFRIALLPIERDEKTESRIGKTNQLFLDLCKSFGADILRDERIVARIEILAQSNYRREDIELIESRVTAERTFWMSGVAMGNAFYSNLFGKRIDKVLVPDRNLYDHRLKVYGDDGVAFPDEMIEEIGMPYRKYPLFDDDLNVDYILAHPTPFSFVTPSDRLDYLEHVLQMVEGISSRGELIAFKPHNADERADYIVNARYYAVLRAPLLRSLHNYLEPLVRKTAALVNNERIKTALTEISIAAVYSQIMKRVIPLREITKHHNLNLEIFLPKVREGLITGRSNSIWHGLFLKMPVWNCVDEEKPYSSNEKMHRHMMTYLNVHGNYKDAVFDKDRFKIIADSTREADLIGFLAAALAENPIGIES
jgi:hypothetical protein